MLHKKKNCSLFQRSYNLFRNVTISSAIPYISKANNTSSSLKKKGKGKRRRESANGREKEKENEKKEQKGKEEKKKEEKMGRGVLKVLL